MIHVLDASALIALFRGEPGGERVGECLAAEECVMSSINLAEFVGKLVSEGGTLSQVEEIVRTLPLEIAPYSTADAFLTGAWRVATRHLGLSLGDRACLALASRLDGLALTTDRPWLKLDIGVRIECVRPAAA
jgi:PIN domain nuclease of toxin-antitoxin system